MPTGILGRKDQLCLIGGSISWQENKPMVMKPEEMLPWLPWRPSILNRALVKIPKTNIKFCLRIRSIMRRLREHAKWMKENAPYGMALEDEILSDMLDFNNELNSHIAWVRKTGKTEGDERISNNALILFEREYLHLYLKARRTWTAAERNKLQSERTKQQIKMAPLLESLNNAIN
jgi:hypothetical protein